MKTKYKFIYFDLIEKGTRTSIIGCYNNQDRAQLGVVKWYPAWRQYCFLPFPDVVFSVSCLQDIAHFVGQWNR